MEGLGVGHDFDADQKAVAHGEGERGDGSPADGDDRPGETVDEAQPRCPGPTGEDLCDRVDTMHLFVQLRRAGVRSGGGHLDGHRIGVKHHVGVQQCQQATSLRCSAAGVSGSAGSKRTRRRARLASLRAATGVRPTMGAISSKGTAKQSCSTNARRSAGSKVSSTTSNARPTESARSASSSGEAPAGSSGVASAGTSCLRSRTRSMSRHTRATTVVSHPPRLSTVEVSERLRRSHASWTASSACWAEPSIRNATARRWARWLSNCRASRSRSLTVTSSQPGSSYLMTKLTGSM